MCLRCRGHGRKVAGPRGTAQLPLGGFGPPLFLSCYTQDAMGDDITIAVSTTADILASGRLSKRAITRLAGC